MPHWMLAHQQRLPSHLIQINGADSPLLLFTMIRKGGNERPHDMPGRRLRPDLVEAPEQR